MNQFKESDLKNGLKVITATVSGAGVVTISVLVQAGSRFEVPGERGYAHVFEHMLWKGTKSRPTVYDISLITDRAGASYNAWTNVEAIRTFIQVAKDKAEEMTELLSDIIKNPLLDETTLENEKKVILEELRQSMDNKGRRVWYESIKRVFKGHPLSNHPIGLEEDIKSATPDKLRDYYRRFFIANNMAVVFSGGITHEDSLAFAEKYFSDVPVGNIEDNSQKIVLQTGDEVVDFPGSQITLNVCFAGERLSEKEAAALDLISTFLGYKHTSLLYQELRHKRGLVYTVSASFSLYRDAFIFYVNTSTTNPEEVKNIILDRTLSFANYFTKETFSGYKSQLINIIARYLDGESALNNHLGSKWALRGRLITPEDEMRGIEALAYEDIISLSKKVFSKDNLFIIRLTPGDGA